MCIWVQEDIWYSLYRATGMATVDQTRLRRKHIMGTFSFRPLRALYVLELVLGAGLLFGVMPALFVFAAAIDLKWE